jgi:hypothetical protein
MTSKRKIAASEALRSPRRDNQDHKGTEQLLCGVGKFSLGTIVLATSKNGIVSILIGDDPEEMIQDLRTRFPVAQLIRNDSETHV